MVLEVREERVYSAVGTLQKVNRCFNKSWLPQLHDSMHFTYLIIPTNVPEKVVIKLLHSS